MKQIFLLLGGVAVFIVLVGVFSQKVQNDDLNLSLPNQKASLNEITVGETSIKVELADTAKKRAEGLSGRKSLKENQGMLFIFEGGSEVKSFWMKEMLMAIDIIWIKDGKVVKINKSIPPPDSGTADKDLDLYSSGEPINYVLEVDAGFSQEKNIQVGDEVDLSGIL